ncbi:MAG: hypothetical protein Q9197_001252 [Variospora fuerteventurae]
MSPLGTTSSPSSNPYIGQEALKDAKFCPLAAVKRFPYKFFHHVDSEKMSKAFFADGKFRMRGWTLYYIHTLLDTSNKPLILVPATEVQALFDDIKKDLRFLVYFPSAEKDPGFLLSFTEEGIPLPRYLGRLDQEHGLDDMEAQLPPFTPEIPTHRLDDRSFAAFRKKMEDAVQATKQKSKFQKDRKKKERIGLKQGWCEEMKRAQCYLGIRPRMAPGMKDPVCDPSISPRELERALRKYNFSQCIELPDVDLSEPVPFDFYNDVVFISVDVEAYEKMNRPITEIGISSLDTHDLLGLSPGEMGKAWMKKIRSRHFRIKETAHLHNSEYVVGCADRFEPEFGQSEWVSFKEAPQIIASCFRPPYSGPVDDGKPGEDGSVSKRQLILVGHDINMDISYLRKLGYDVANLSNLLEALDTANLYRAWKHEQNPSKLGSILVDLELTGWNLHNAGNDAAYTLQALIGIAISARKSEAARMKNTQPRIAGRAEALEHEARERAKEEADEWAAADQEGGDGGGPRHLKRFGWPTPEQAAIPATNVKYLQKDSKGSAPNLSGTRPREAAPAAIPVSKQEEENEAKKKPFMGTFSQSISDKLAMLEMEDGEKGGVKLPGRFAAP